MYFFLSNLSVCEIFVTTTLIPNMVYILWLNGGFISFYGCIIQYYRTFITGSVEFLILTVMAICNPLRYSSIININTRNHLVAWAWVAGFTVKFMLIIMICYLQFCGSNTIDHFFYDIAPLLQLSTSDTSLVDMKVIFRTIFLGVVPFVLVTVSYISIFSTILRTSSRSGRQKNLLHMQFTSGFCFYVLCINMCYLFGSFSANEKDEQVHRSVIHCCNASFESNYL